MKPKICPKCNSVIAGNAVVCVNCGEKLEMPPKWYTKNGVIIAFLIFFFPVGLFLMWKYSKWNIALKIIITILFASLILYDISNYDNTQTTNTNTNSQPATSDVTSSTNNSKPSEEIMKVDCYQLYNDYKDNEISADTKYKGKTLQITGQVYDIYRAIDDKPYVSIKMNGFEGIRLKFKTSEEPKLADLSKGQTITVKGKCDGKSVINVSLSQCEIIN